MKLLMLGEKLLNVSELLKDKQAPGLFFMLCVLDNTRNKVSDLTDLALFQDESEPAESKHVQIGQTRLHASQDLLPVLGNSTRALGSLIFSETLET